MASVQLSDTKYFSQLIERHFSLDSQEIGKFHNENDMSLVATLTEIGKRDRNLIQSFVSDELQVHCEGSVTDSEVTDFKNQYLKELSLERLIDSIYTRPQITLQRSKWTETLTIKSITHRFAFELFLIQDFILSTKQGIIVTHQRDYPYASSVVAFALENSSEISYRPKTVMKPPTRLSGSDYISLGAHVTLLGVGPSTNTEAANFLMNNSLLGTPYVVIIKDCFDWNPSRLHLRDVLQLENDRRVSVLDVIAGHESVLRRLVDLYHKPTGSDHYKLIGNGIELCSFLKDNLQLEVQVKKSLTHDNVHSLFSSVFPQSSLQSSLSEKVFGISKHRFSASLAFSPETNLAVDYSKMSNCKRPWPNQSSSSQQTTDVVLMVAPTNFTYNYETAQDNSFMNAVNISAVELRKNVLREFSQLCQVISQRGIDIHVILNDTEGTADAVFPNNWFSTQNLPSSDPTLVLYTMKSEARRKERNVEIIERLKQNYSNVVDYTSYEKEVNPLILEGTGALVLDHVNKIAYVCISQRADQQLSELWAKKFGYRLVSFKAVDRGNSPIYHTNVVMSVGTKVAILCEECIPDETERKMVIEMLSKHHTIVTITYDQMNSFAGNVLELKGEKGNSCALMSKTAYDSFTDEQKKVFADNQVEMVFSDIHYLETIGGGSVRCCIAQLF